MAEREGAVGEGIVAEEEDGELGRGITEGSLETRGVERGKDLGRGVLEGEGEVNGARTGGGRRVVESTAREEEGGIEEGRIEDRERGGGAWRMCQLCKTPAVEWLLNSRRNKIIFVVFLIAGLLLAAVVIGLAIGLSPRGTIPIAELLRRAPLIEG